MPYPFLIKDMLERGVKLNPNKEIVCYESSLESEVRCTYEEFYSRVCQTANVLKDLGVERGDIVPTFAHNSSRHLELHFAVPMMGAVFEPLTITQPSEIHVDLLNRYGQKVLFIDEQFIPTFEKIHNQLKTVNTYVVLTDEVELSDINLPNVHSYEDLMSKASSEFTFPEDLDENDPALLFNTSGTTGKPKAGMHSHRSIFTQALDYGLVDGFRMCREDVILAAMPIWYFNSWNFPYAAALYGAKIVLPPSPPDGVQIGKLIEREKATLCVSLSSFVTQWAASWEKEGWKYDFSSLDRMLCVGSTRVPMAALRNLVNKTGIGLVAAGGCSEACPMYSMAIPESRKWKDQEKVLKTDGIVPPLVKYKVVDFEGNEIKHDGREVGMIGVKGPHVIEEYYKDPEATAKSFDKEGYFFPGDMVSVDPDGYITCAERIQDLIKGKDGFIRPSILEGIVGKHPAVVEAAAIGIPDGEFERPVVCVVLAESHKGKISEEDLAKEFKGKVSESSIPEIIFIEKLPRGATGKFDKGALKKQMIEQLL